MVLMLLTATFIGVIIISQRWFLKRKKSIKFIGKNKNKKSMKFVVSEYLL